ncbi:MAG: hypothetical protein JXR95_05230 [Deltaproteobacteria bacterium]|nr:hypothetical protein [Deltaproteobacteria bacterium]
MNNDNGLPPLDPNVTPENSAPAPMAPPPPAYNPYDVPAVGGVKSGSGLKVGIVILLGLLTLLVPLGLFKIGSPHPCGDDRAKKGECVIVQTPSGCTPSVFSMESEFLTCKMVGAVGNEDFKAKNPSKWESCNALNEKIKAQKGFKCYAPAAVLKAKAKGGKLPDPMDMPPLEVQKMSALNSVSSSTITSDMVFTVITILIILGLMAGAAFFSHKKNREGFLHVSGVFLVGIFAAFIYRYYVAGFYSGDIVVMMIALLGVVPMIMMAVSREGKLGTAMGIAQGQGGDYAIDTSKKDVVPPSEALSAAEATKFERMAMKHTAAWEIAFILGFITLVLSLLPIGLVSMGKTSNADSAMKKEAAKLTSLVKKKESATTDVNVDVGEGGSGEDGEGDED